MSRIGILDIGTNSVLSLAAEKCPGQKIKWLGQMLRSPRLGENLSDTGHIQSEPLDRTIQAIQELYSSLDTDHTIAVGTQAFRKAINCEDALNKISQQTQLDVRVLSPEEEAGFSFSGALTDVESSGNKMVLDIGGGSTEIISGTKRQIKSSVSLNLGAVQLRDTFKNSSLDHEELLNQIRETIVSQLNIEDWQNSSTHSQLIGVGGTVTTLSAMHQHLQTYISDKIHGSVLTCDQIHKLLETMQNMSDADLKKWLVFDPQRADIILFGTIILEQIMQAGSFTRIQISDYGLRHGIANDYFAKLEHNSPTQAKILSHFIYPF